MSPDGRYLAFSSDATNLVAGDTNGAADVFVKDRVTGAIERISVASDGHQGTADPATCPAPSAAGSAAISRNGRYVAFASCFDNLVPGPLAGQWRGDTNLYSDIFVHDRVTGVTTRVSVDSHGVQGNYLSRDPAISADGRIVVFGSPSTNFDPPPCPADLTSQAGCVAGSVSPVYTTQIFAHDMKSGATKLVSRSTMGGRPNDAAYDPFVSLDGRMIGFTSLATDLVAGDTRICSARLVSNSKCRNVFVRDLKTGGTTRVSVGIDGQPANDSSTTPSDGTQSISADDRFVAFSSYASNLVPNPGLSPVSVYIRDLKAERTYRVGVDSSGTPLAASSYSVSPDGRHVAFAGPAWTLQCSAAQVRPATAAVRDLATGETDDVGRVAANGQTNDCDHYYNVFDPQVSAGGRYVSFLTSATDLVSPTTNGQSQLFVRDRGDVLGIGSGKTAGVSVMGHPAFSRDYLLSSADALSDVPAALQHQGMDILRASLAYRPALSDLYLRIELRSMPAVAATLPTTVYAVALRARGVDYELRVAWQGTDAAFALFRRDVSGWQPVTSAPRVAGGYGTTGQEVVASIPLAALGLQHGGRIAAVSARTGLGNFATGITTVVDSLQLAG